MTDKVNKQQPLITETNTLKTTQDCQICGSPDFETKTLIIDEQTGERPVVKTNLSLGGIALFLFGLVCFVLGIALVIDPLPSNVDANRSPIYFIGIGLILLWNGAAIFKSSMGGKKVEVTRPECSVCWASWEQTRLYHKNKRQLALANLCFVFGGIFLLLVVSILISVIGGGYKFGVWDTIIRLVILMAIGGLLTFAGMTLRRRANHIMGELLAAVEINGEHYHCKCGKPKNLYYWGHVALCFTIYGFIALFFPLRKCRHCKEPYYAAAIETEKDKVPVFKQLEQA